MYETEFITAGLTIIGGIIIFAGGQLINEFVIKPIVSLKQEIGKIAFALTFHANMYTSPNLRGLSIDVDKHNCANELRKRASHLRATINAVPDFAVKFFRLPSKFNIFKASDNLIFLSNSTFDGDALANQRKREETEKLLKIAY